MVEGESLAFALDNKLEKKFLNLALACASVLCCRSTPKQKALVSIIIMLILMICLLKNDIFCCN